VLGDHAYGENTWLRDRLHQAGCEYVLSVGPTTKVFEQGPPYPADWPPSRALARLALFPVHNWARRAIGDRRG
jgi:hypothetical protein